MVMAASEAAAAVHSQSSGGLVGTDTVSTLITSLRSGREVVKPCVCARADVVIDDDDDESSVESDDEVPPLQEGATRTESGVVREKQRAMTMQNAEHFTQRVRHHEEREKSASIFGGTPGMATFLGARADASELLVAKHGWLDKQRPSWLNTWQRRWFVLCNKQLQWYNDPEDTAPLGVVDFDLVVCEIECLWDTAVQLGTTVRTVKARGNCAWCDPLSAVERAMSRVTFRVCPVGSDRAFVLRAHSREEGEAWLAAVAQHIACADDEASVLPSQLNTLGRRHWWKVKRVTPEKFVHIAQTGDVLLFRSEGTAPMIIRAASGGHFDHVALILKLHDGNLALFEATGNLGVGVCTWAEFVENSWQNLYPEIAIRRVRFQRTADRLAALEAWCFAVNGKPYSLTISKLRQRESVSSGQVGESNSFFCSELVAEALKVLEVLPRGLSSTQWWPSSFETSQQLPVETCPHASFGEQLTIDFSLGKETSKPAEQSDAHAKQRDATTNW